MSKTMTLEVSLHRVTGDPDTCDDPCDGRAEGGALCLAVVRNAGDAVSL